VGRYLDHCSRKLKRACFDAQKAEHQARGRAPERQFPLLQFENEIQILERMEVTQIFASLDTPGSTATAGLEPTARAGTA
jgi:hypothetical protein